MAAGRHHDLARGDRRIVAVALVTVATVLGAVARLPGLGRAGLYFDDAWFALPARVPFTTALKMVVTAPGYTLLQREWIHLGPGGNLWPKVLSYVLGVACIPGMYFLARRLGFGFWLSLAMTGLIAASPAAIEYSVRVKEYEGDLLLAVLLLLVGEQARRCRDRRTLVMLGAASIIAVAMSTSVFVVVAGVWLAVLVETLFDRSSLPRVLAIGTGTAIITAVPLLWIAGRIPPQLTAFWRANDHLFGYHYSLHHVGVLLSAMPLGFAHGLVGTPAGESRVLLGHSLRGVVAAIFGLAVMGGAVHSVARSCRRGADSDRRVGTSSLAALLVAVLLWVGGLVPLGTGRTDLVLYPSAAVLAALAAREVIASLRRRPTTRGAARSIVGAVGVSLGIACVALAWHSASWYPAQDLSDLPAATTWWTSPSTAVLVTDRNSYTWAFEGLSPFRVHINRTDPQSTTVGYWVTFSCPRVLELSAPASTPWQRVRPTISGLGTLPPRIDRLWLFATTASTFNPSAGHLTGRAATRILPSAATPLLLEAGWHPTGEVERAPGVAAILYVRSH